MAHPYVLPNRKAFADSITRIFKEYRAKDKDPLDEEDKNVDMCQRQLGSTTELFPYQKLIRDYMQIETPYRGILLYHGLGSGKTCSSIAVAESLLTRKKVFVLLPSSLEKNYREELTKCGDPVYAVSQNWSEKLLTDEVRAEGKALGLSDAIMDKNKRIFTTTAGQPPNFEALPKNAQEMIRAQIKDLLDQRFHFIHYNGLTQNNIKNFTEEGAYDDSVVIIDEAHNLTSSVTNESDIRGKLYDALYRAKQTKIVLLSGTPIINRPNEISYMMNLLRGPVERITIPFKSIPTWDEEKIATALRNIPDVDTIEFNALKKLVLVTRNPAQFRSTYNSAGDRIAVQYMKDMPYIPTAVEWVSSIKNKLETEITGEIAAERVTTEELQCLPTDFKEFSDLFLDGLQIKNPMMFRRRIQGLVSYFKGADERLLPKRVDDEHMLEKIPMSNEQFMRYLEVRWIEMKIDSRKNRSMNEDMGSYRVGSRLACNYAIPPELRIGEATAEGEDVVPEKSDILAKLKANPKRYLSEEALASFGPKLLKMLENVKTSQGGNQFVYSQYTSLEGLGVFSAVLEAAGWQQYKIVKQANQWVEDPSLDSERPAYTLYTGKESFEERDLTRQIFNGVYSKNFPASLKQSVEARGKKILSLLMASSTGAEGITLTNVRHVHIMEPHWNPSRHDQVIGRAIRICSHATIPMEERTVKISFYVSVFTPEQMRSAEFPNIVSIRRNDTSIKRYEGEPVETFMSSDEYLYETAYEKERISQRIGLILKESAVDCEVHRKLHRRENPVVSCMRFDSTVTGEDLAYKPSITSEELDATGSRNVSRKHRRLQKVLVKGISLLIDPDTKEVFDGPAFDDNQRLLRLGIMESATTIRFLLY